MERKTLKAEYGKDTRMLSDIVQREHTMCITFDVISDVDVLDIRSEKLMICDPDKMSTVLSAYIASDPKFEEMILSALIKSKIV